MCLSYLIKILVSLANTFVKSRVLLVLKYMALSALLMLLALLASLIILILLSSSTAGKPAGSTFTSYTIAKNSQKGVSIQIALYLNQLKQKSQK